MHNGISRKPAYRLLVVLALLAAVLPHPRLCAQEKGIAGVTKETVRAERSRRWAVLIGVNHYVDKDGIGDLKYSVQDMKLLRATLTSEAGGFEYRNVLLMTDDAEKELDRPTRNNLVTQVPYWLEQAGADDDVLIAFSGHGIFRDGKAYLLPSNARMLNLRLTAVPLQAVREWLDACKAKRKVLILDCCHAGAGKAPSIMDKRLLAEIEKGEGFVRLASCRQDQKSNEDVFVENGRKRGHGVFTYYLCKGLVGNGDFDRDGRVDVDEAYRYALREVRAWAQRKRLRQDPVKSGTVEGLITLTYRPGVPGKKTAKKVKIPEFKLPDETMLDFSIPELGGDAPVRIEKLKELLGKKRADIKKNSEWYAEGSAQMKALRGQESALTAQLKGAAGEAAKSLEAQIEAIDRAWAEGERRRWKPAHPEMKKLAQARAEAQKKLAPLAFLTGEKQVLLDLGNGVTMKLVLIPSGEFMMGSDKGDSDEKPVQRVRITKPFYMAVTEVTQEQWKAVMGAEPWSGKTYRGRSKDAPVNYVSWNDARDFCKKLSTRAGSTMRLPTEAEWEYACRAGSRTAYCFGDGTGRLGEYAWYEDNAEDAGEDYPHRVGQKKPNAWGLYDMHGNVWEWCADWYDKDYYKSSPTDDPTGPRSGEYRVLRGGSWNYGPVDCRSADRVRCPPGFTSYCLGFRVAASARP